MEEISEAGWNLSQTTIQLVADTMRQATLYYNRGELTRCFFAWKSIKFCIQNRFSQEEKDLLKNFEKKMKEESVIKRKEKFDEEKIFFDETKFAELLEEYIDMMTDLLRKYKLDITDKEKKLRLG